MSTTERLGELALLKALGLAPRQLLAWLSVENVALLVVGLTVGVLLGPAPRLARAAVRDADVLGRDAGPGPGGRRAARGAAADAGAGPPARRRDGPARASPAARRPGRARSCARGTSRWAGPGSPSAASATTGPRRSGSRVLVLVTAFLAALAPRVIAGACRQRGPVRGRVRRRSRRATSRCSRTWASRAGSGRGPARARPRGRARARGDVPRRGPGTDREPERGRRVGAVPGQPADDGSRVRQAPDPGGRGWRRPLRRGPAAHGRRHDTGRRRARAGRRRAGVRGGRVARDGGGVRVDAGPDRAAHGRSGRPAASDGARASCMRSRR